MGLNDRLTSAADRMRDEIAENDAKGIYEQYIKVCARVAEEMVSEALARLEDGGLLTFGRLQAIDAQRARKWHEDMEPWSGADWSNAMQGEAGEAGNVVKKMRRIETKRRRMFEVMSDEDSREYNLLRQSLAEELADTIIYAAILADFYGIDLGGAVVEKFNDVSELRGFEERL